MAKTTLFKAALTFGLIIMALKAPSQQNMQPQLPENNATPETSNLFDQRQNVLILVLYGISIFKTITKFGLKLLYLNQARPYSQARS